MRWKKREAEERFEKEKHVVLRRDSSVFLSYSLTHALIHPVSPHLEHRGPLTALLHESQVTVGSVQTGLYYGYPRGAPGLLKLLGSAVGVELVPCSYVKSGWSAAFSH